jgi:hypothetical protein
MRKAAVNKECMYCNNNAKWVVRVRSTLPATMVMAERIVEWWLPVCEHHSELPDHVEEV